MLSSVFVEVSVEATPPGSWTVQQFDAPESSETAMSAGLRHSAHGDERVIGLTARWIEATARRERDGTDRIG